MAGASGPHCVWLPFGVIAQMTDLDRRLVAALAARYTVTQELGRGGMATVYLATDVKHHRSVAIKVLLPELAHAVGADRFLREIELTARLDHPHILSLLDSGATDDYLYYAMPYVEGETLRDRLTREKQLSIDDAVQIAREVADALSYAHSRGVMHRDIKPENILLASGHARVADFGIARAITVAGAGKLTETGLAVGTPAYMSPEQAAGSTDVDSRTDIYSLACVTYEMLGGQPPFTGPTPDSVIRQHLAVLAHAVTELRPSVSPHIADAVARGLAKMPADRFATPIQFASALGTTSQPTAPAPVLAHSSPLRRLRAAAPWSLAVAALAIAVFMPRPSAAPSDPPLRSYTIVLPDTAPLAFVGSSVLGIGRHALAIARDGSTIAYVAAVGSTTMLYTRRSDVGDVKPVAESEGAYAPFFSPDGKWIGFLTGTELKKVSTAGGSALTVTTLSEPYSAAWLPDDRIVVCETSGLAVVSASTGTVRTLTGPGCGSPSPVSVGNRWLLDNSNRVISFVPPEDSAQRLMLGSDGKLGTTLPYPERVFGSSPQFVGRTHLVFAQSGGDGTLVALPFDTSVMRARGNAVPVVRGVRIEAGADGVAQYAVSDEGTLVFAAGTNEMLSRLVFRDRDGRHDTLPFPRLDLDRHQLSPDGYELAAQLWRPGVPPRFAVFDIRRGTFTLLPDSLDNCTWTSDRTSVLCGKHISAGKSVTLRISVLTSAIEDTVIHSGGSRSVSIDGQVHVVERIRAGVWLTRRTASGEASVPVRGANVLTAVSPSGKWIAMTVYVAGVSQVFVAPTDNVDQRVQVSTNGGEEPLWSADENEIVYRFRSTWYSVDASARSAMTFKPPRKLFDGPYYNARGYSHALAPDGRLLLILGSQARTTKRIEVVTGWFAELRRLAPGTSR